MPIQPGFTLSLIRFETILVSHDLGDLWVVRRFEPYSLNARWEAFVPYDLQLKEARAGNVSFSQRSFSSPCISSFKWCWLSLSQTRSTVGHRVPEPLALVASTSRAAMHLSRPELENISLLLLQNGSRTPHWLVPLWPAMLPTTRRPTGTLRQHPQPPTPWDKNVCFSSIYYKLENHVKIVLFITLLFLCRATQRDLLWVKPNSAHTVVCFPELFASGRVWVFMMEDQLWIDTVKQLLV